MRRLLKKPFQPVEIAVKLDSSEGPAIIVSGMVHFKTLNKDMTLNR